MEGQEEKPVVAVVAKASFAPDEDAVNKLLQGIDSWSFDIFQIEDDDLPKVKPSSLPNLFQHNKRQIFWRFSPPLTPELRTSDRFQSLFFPSCYFGSAPQNNNKPDTVSTSKELERR